MINYRATPFATGFQRLTPRRSPHIPAKYCTFRTLYAPYETEPRCMGKNGKQDKLTAWKPDDDEEYRVERALQLYSEAVTVH